MMLSNQVSCYICKCIRSVKIKIDISFFKLQDVMEAVVISKILHEVLKASWNFISAHCLHNIIKVEKENFNY